MSSVWTEARRWLRPLPSVVVWAGPQAGPIAPAAADRSKAGSSGAGQGRPHAVGSLADWSAWCAWCAHQGAAAVRLVVSQHWLHEWPQPADLPLHGPAQCLAHARLQLRHYHGAEADAWTLTPWASGAGRGVSALHGLDLAAWQHEALRHGLRLHAVQPAWSRALSLAGPQLQRVGRWDLLWVEGLVVTRLSMHGRHLRLVQTRRLSRPHLADLLQRLPQWAQADRDSAPGPAGRASTEGLGPPPTWLLGGGLSTDAASRAQARQQALALRLGPEGLALPDPRIWQGPFQAEASAWPVEHRCEWPHEHSGAVVPSPAAPDPHPVALRQDPARGQDPTGRSMEPA